MAQQLKKPNKFWFFIKNEKAVLGMPMRLTVILIIGIIALIAILAFILNPCLFPKKMIVSAKQNINEISSGDEATFNIDFHVTDKNGNPIKNAKVIVTGLEGAGYGKTDNNGDTTVNIKVRLDPGRSQGFLDVKVKVDACFEEFHQKDMIAVVRS